MTFYSPSLKHPNMYNNSYKIYISSPEQKLTGITCSIELDREEDGRWIADIPSLPGVMTYGATREKAIADIKALALERIADRIQHHEIPSNIGSITFSLQ